MGAFNTVDTTSRCAQCGSELAVQVQFKYGDVWQHAYVAGDTIRWGGNDVGAQTDHSVVVDGVAEARCGRCGHHEDLDFYVLITEGMIAAVEVADGRYSFSLTGDRFMVLDGP